MAILPATTQAATDQESPKPSAVPFALYFPAAEDYQGRFFQSTYPTVAQENAAPNAVFASLSVGSYVVQTNNGGGTGGYRINAAAAKYSREIAANVYGGAERPRGYLYGQSGGAYQTIAGAENSERVWDGTVPIVNGTPNSIPSFASAQVLALRVLGDKLPQIADAMEPGGTGDPYAGLSDEQARVLDEVTTLGHPLSGWWQYASLTGGSLKDTAGAVRQIDGSYENDFWTKQGYAGTDPKESAAAARIQANATVVATNGTPTTQLELSAVPSGYLTGAEIVVTSGTAQNQRLPLGSVSGNKVGFGDAANAAVIAQIKPGDQVRIDNSWYLALQYYHRYQLPSTDQYGWNQYRDSAGVPTQPQRAFLVGPLFANFSGGAVATGDVHGKMIVLSSLNDVEAFPWAADWFRSKVTESLGSATDDNFRLWYLDNSGHTGPKNAYDATHNIDYNGAVFRALLDVDEWVLRGDAPASTTQYSVSETNQVVLPNDADDRHGVQATVALVANGAQGRADVVVGKKVDFTTEIDAADEHGVVSKVEWDFEGDGTFATGEASASHAYLEPGTYFPVVRVSTKESPTASDTIGLVQNLARVRVVVAADTERPKVALVAPTAAGPFARLSVKVDATDNGGLSRIVANIYKDGVLVKSTQSPMNGAAAGTHKAEVTLPDGAYTVKYNAQDLAGNISQTSTFAFAIDSAKPTVTVKEGDSFTKQTGASYDLVSFRLHDAGKVDKVTLNGKVKDLSDNAWSDVNFVKPGTFGAVRGENVLVVYDVAGNAQETRFTLN